MRKSSFILIVTISIIAVMIDAIPQPHAINNHGDEAIRTRQCLTNNRLAWHEADGKRWQYWQSKEDPNTFYQACQLPDGKWGFQAVRKNNGRWWEKTAFV